MMTAILSGREVMVRGDEVELRNIKRIAGSRKLRNTNTWMVPLTLETGRTLTECRAQMDAQLAGTLASMENVQRQIEYIKAAPVIEPKKPAPIKKEFSLFNHQKKGFVLGLCLPYFAALMDMGTGKTLTTVAIAGRRFLDKKIERLLILAPTSVCAVWPSEFEKFGDFPVRVAVLLGDREKRIRQLKKLEAPVFTGMENPLRVAVINYESSWRLEEELAAYKPDMIVCDESQRIKSPNAKQSKAVRRLGRLARYRMILSGTPVQNNTLDLWSQYDFLDPGIFACNFYAFQMRYAFLGGFSGKEYLGPKNIEELTRKAHSIAYRVTKEECLDLPEQMFEDFPVILEDRAAKLYKQIKAESVAELSGGATVTAQIVLVRLLRLQQLTGGFLTLDNGAVQQVSTAKLDALADIVESQCVDARKKLVVFARFIPELDGIKKTVEEVLGKSDEPGLSCVMIRGDVKAQDRGGLVARFQTDPKCRVFLGELDACAEGITLTAADTTVYYSVNWNYSKYSQSVSRIHRTGQRMPCTYIHLVVPGSIDTKIMAVLQAKGELADSVVNNWQKYFD